MRSCLFSSSGLPSTVVLPITTNLSTENTFPLRVSVPRGVCGLKAPIEILVDQILAWDNSLFFEDLGEISDEIQIEVSRALREFLDLG